uniref:DNA-directed RNA polymerase III subunit RPC6-like n=1 Tax=Erigeron canadensis TaxID=72917 RepID=UPI001CB8BD00|nr:DNA-directed RNA polymerase III subunit RPC6-like [Erigeron canadensis]
MSLLQKRKRPEARSAGGLTETNRLVLNVIKSKGADTITDWNIKKETNLQGAAFNKIIKNLKDLALIKEIRRANAKGKHFIAAEFEPTDEVTGGVWFTDGALDTDFINQLKGICLKIIKKLKVATAEGVYDFFKENRLTKTECTSQQLSEILKTLVLDNAIIEVKSTGLGEYFSIPIGNVCYRCLDGNLGDHGPKLGAMVSIPCGVCPRMKQCTPDGLISPTNCVYYTKWLEF